MEAKKIRFGTEQITESCKYNGKGVNGITFINLSDNNLSVEILGFPLAANESLAFHGPNGEADYTDYDVRIPSNYQGKVFVFFQKIS